MSLHCVVLTKIQKVGLSNLWITILITLLSLKTAMIRLSGPLIHRRCYGIGCILRHRTYPPTIYYIVSTQHLVLALELKVEYVQYSTSILYNTQLLVLEFSTKI